MAMDALLLDDLEAPTRFEVVGSLAGRMTAQALEGLLHTGCMGGAREA